jgi:hypothetical protein
MTEEQEALDPNTPPARLAALMETHLAAVLKNPGWPLVLLAEPDFWRRLSGRALLHAAQAPRCPEALATWMVGHVTEPLVLGRVAANRALSAATRRAALLQVPRPLEEDEVDAHADLLTESEASLLRRCAHLVKAADLELEDFEALEQLGLRGKFIALNDFWTPSEVVARLEPLFPREAAFHPNLPLARLEALLQSPDLDVRRQAAINPALARAPGGLLARVAMDPVTRPEVAQFSTLTPEWFEDFLKDPDAQLRVRLASNVDLPDDVQLRLAADPAREVRAALLRNLNVTPDARRLALRTNRQATARRRAGSP